MNTTVNGLSVNGLTSQTHGAALNAGLDANGQVPERVRAMAGVNPCRHCLGFIAEGEPMLIMAHRPFPKKQAYAEVGPIFFHGNECAHYSEHALPAWFMMADHLLVRGYTKDDRIQYDTGVIITGAELEAQCVQILARADIAYVHIRSKFNCFLCRVDRVEKT